MWSQCPRGVQLSMVAMTSGVPLAWRTWDRRRAGRCDLRSCLMLTMDAHTHTHTVRTQHNHPTLYQAASASDT